MKPIAFLAALFFIAAAILWFICLAEGRIFLLWVNLAVMCGNAFIFWKATS